MENLKSFYYHKPVLEKLQSVLLSILSDDIKSKDFNSPPSSGRKNTTLDNWKQLHKLLSINYDDIGKNQISFYYSVVMNFHKKGEEIVEGSLKYKDNKPYEIPLGYFRAAIKKLLSPDYKFKDKNPELETYHNDRLQLYITFIEASKLHLLENTNAKDSDKNNIIEWYKLQKDTHYYCYYFIGSQRNSVGRMLLSISRKKATIELYKEEMLVKTYQSSLLENVFSNNIGSHISFDSYITTTGDKLNISFLLIFKHGNNINLFQLKNGGFLSGKFLGSNQISFVPRSGDFLVEKIPKKELFVKKKYLDDGKVKEDYLIKLTALSIDPEKIYTPKKDYTPNSTSKNNEEIYSFYIWRKFSLRVGIIKIHTIDTSNDKTTKSEDKKGIASLVYFRGKGENYQKITTIGFFTKKRWGENEDLYIDFNDYNVKMILNKSVAKSEDAKSEDAKSEDYYLGDFITVSTKVKKTYSGKILLKKEAITPSQEDDRKLNSLEQRHAINTKIWRVLKGKTNFFSNDAILSEESPFKRFAGLYYAFVVDFEKHIFSRWTYYISDAGMGLRIKDDSYFMYGLYNIHDKILTGDFFDKLDEDSSRLKYTFEIPLTFEDYLMGVWSGATKSQKPISGRIYLEKMNISIKKHNDFIGNDFFKTLLKESKYKELDFSNAKNKDQQKELFGHQYDRIVKFLTGRSLPEYSGVNLSISDNYFNFEGIEEIWIGNFYLFRLSSKKDNNENILDCFPVMVDKNGNICVSISDVIKSRKGLVEIDGNRNMIAHISYETEHGIIYTSQYNFKQNNFKETIKNTIKDKVELEGLFIDRTIEGKYVCGRCLLRKLGENDTFESKRLKMDEIGDDKRLLDFFFKNPDLNITVL